MPDTESQALAAFDAAEAADNTNNNAGGDDGTSTGDDSNGGQDNNGADTSASDNGDASDDTNDSGDTGDSDSDADDDTSGDQGDKDADKDQDATADADDKGDDTDEDADQSADQTQELPAFEQYIYDNLADLQVVDDKGKTHTVKVAEELPDDFKFASDKERMIFQQKLVDQNYKANKLATSYQQAQQTKTATETRRTEAKAISTELKQLQKEGLVPKFKSKLGADGFEKDPGYQQANKAFELMAKVNADYAKRGYPNRIGLREAVNQMKLKEYQDRESKHNQDNDVKRRNTAGRVGANRGASAGDGKRRIVPGTKVEDILNYHLNSMDA